MKDDKNLKLFSENIKELISSGDRNLYVKQFQNNNFLFRGQCMYALNFKNQEISWKKNIKELLGYEDHEFSFEFSHSPDFIHPEDFPKVTKLLKEIVSFVIKSKTSPLEFSFILTYRVKKKDGNYIYVLRQSSVIETDEKGTFISNVSSLTDISLLGDITKVDWDLIASDQVMIEYRNHLKESHKSFFTERERQILILIMNGNSSKMIGDILKIGKHTVDTHRRNMLRKSNTGNTHELAFFAQKNAMI